jgi:hypothetical protein
LFLFDYLQPTFAIGLVRLSAVIACLNSYQHMREGGWFLALISVATSEYRRVGLNIHIEPLYRNRLYGGISFQMKFKLTE